MRYNDNYNNNDYGQHQMPLGTIAKGQILTKKGWKPYKKKSGAKEVSGNGENGTYWGVSAWFANRNTGLVKISAFKNRKSTEYKNERGEKGISLMFEVIYTRTGQKHLEVATYKYSTGKAFLKTLGIVISTKAPNGGFCGFLRKN